MWKDANKPAPIALFLGWTLFLTILVQGVLLILEPCSIAYTESGKFTLGYGVYALIGMLFSTPSPLLALFLTLRRAERISPKEYFKRILSTPHPLRAAAVTGAFCLAALIFALIFGKSNGGKWYMLPLGFLVMLPFVGIAEEPGWRGFLQPELERKFPFPVAVSFTAVIWYIWHLPVWLMPTSNHYGDSLIGFAIMIFVWSFVSAAIYKSTKSCLACAAYHAFINAIGAVYDWNALFDCFPKSGGMYVYFALILLAAVLIWLLSDKKESKAVSEI